MSAALLAAGAGSALAQAPAPGTVVDEPEATAEAPRRVPRWILQGPGGRAAMATDFAGRYQLVAFGYVSCPDVCPTTMLEMQQVLAALGERAAKLQPIFVSVDPQRDTLPVLTEYTRAFDRRILGLTGRPELVDIAAKAFDVSYRIVREPGAAPNAYTVDHSAGLFLVGPDGQLLTRFGYSTPVEQVVQRIQRWMDVEPR
ncbi:MAG TPA: SCO family protein [Burkholderiaceae bacterium]|nr:SCO family protein [Burkholderiaceae bacterium]